MVAAVDIKMLAVFGHDHRMVSVFSPTLCAGKFFGEVKPTVAA